jgi:hypothetical protein
MLKGQDVILLILLRLRSEHDWTYGLLSQALGISTSQCHLAASRLQKAKLLEMDSNRFGKVSGSNFEEYVIHALKYDFPGEIGPVMRGIPTVHSVNFVARDFLKNDKLSNINNDYVWPHPNGTLKGNSLNPIHDCQIHLIGNLEHSNLQYNADIYEFLVCVDLIRIGQAREKKWAEDKIRERAWKS